MTSQGQRKLRFITYLSPCERVEFFQTIMEYLEKKLSVESYLIYESRWEGPPEGRPDPFTSDEADVGFINSSSFLRLSHEKNPHVVHLPVGAVHVHDKNISNQAVYYSDVIIHSDQEDKYDTFHDLKGCRWAYTDDNSVSGNLSTLSYLRSIGTNANFFGNTIRAGGHLKAIKMVYDHRVDAAAVSSVALNTFRAVHPEYSKKIHTLTSWGPLPIHPIVINSRIPDEMKKSIEQHLLNMNKDNHWKKKLDNFGVVGFIPVSSSLYDHEVALKDNTKNLSLGAVYY
ncbi:uncharacterized protein LOC135483126 [Lineus longissimus]|uniref:uncharacterized protein LOC135483126 n=1 Tax=Lineus longissimus TaxID=88925 RepID=UPI002B4F1363